MVILVEATLVWLVAGLMGPAVCGYPRNPLEHQSLCKLPPPHSSDSLVCASVGEITQLNSLCWLSAAASSEVPLPHCFPAATLF